MDIDELRSRVSAELPRIREDLEALVRIESVSADPARAAEVQRSAEAVAELFGAEGFEDVMIVSAREDGRAPAVLARKPAPEGDPTVLLYAHHDVQPENDHAEWDSPPFEPTERDGRLYGRGAADDKAGIAAHLAAVRALGDDLGVGVTMFVEGEEEVGSDTLADLLEAAPGLPVRRRDRDRRLRQLGHRRPGPDHQPARPRPGRHRRAHADPRRPLRHVGRPGARRADGAEPADHQPARRRGQRGRGRSALGTGGRRRLPGGASPGRVRASPRAWSSSAPARRSSGCGPSRR